MLEITLSFNLRRRVRSLGIFYTTKDTLPARTTPESVPVFEVSLTGVKGTYSQATAHNITVMQHEPSMQIYSEISPIVGSGS